MQAGILLETHSNVGFCVRNLNYRERMKLMNIIICDDDSEYLDKLDSQVHIWIEKNHREEAKVIAYHSSEDLLAELEKGLRSDVFLLDILFDQEMNGLDLAWEIRKRDQRTMIIFVTHSEAYAKNGYAVQAFRYLSKPISYEDLSLCLDVAYRQYTLAHNEYLILSNAGKRTVIRYDQIIYIEARSPHIEIHRFQEGEGIIKIRGTLSMLEGKLPNELFVQCHRSYIVNVLNVQSIQRKELRLTTGFVIPVARSRYRQLCDVFDSYYQGGLHNYVVDC